VHNHFYVNISAYFELAPQYVDLITEEITLVEALAPLLPHVETIALVIREPFFNNSVSHVIWDGADLLFVLLGALRTSFPLFKLPEVGEDLPSPRLHQQVAFEVILDYHNLDVELPAHYF